MVRLAHLTCAYDYNERDECLYFGKVANGQQQQQQKTGINNSHNKKEVKSEMLVIFRQSFYRILCVCTTVLGHSG